MPAQINKGDPRPCAIYIMTWGSNWGSSDFSRNQNNQGSTGAYVTSIYCVWAWRWPCVKWRTTCKDHGRILFLGVWLAKNPKTPNLSPMVDDAITRAIYEVWDPLCISVVASLLKEVKGLTEILRYVTNHVLRYKLYI